ncbi:MAG: PaaI family thioesterase [Turneriella sp.]|nr:PaaI family thioesterase [Leptospiraceae bacterium]MCX7632362.1 PaaI family thioesterase [Turneriella sp.]
MFAPEKPSLVGQELHHDNCLGCGALNNYSFHIPSNFDITTGEVRFSYQLRREHEGAPGHAHGGALALLLDEAQGVLCHHLGYFVMTDGISLKYHKATPLYRDLSIHAWLSSARSKRLYTKATIELDGELLVESKAKWYIIPERLLERRFGRSAMWERMRARFDANRMRAKEIRRRLRQKASS